GVHVSPHCTAFVPKRVVRPRALGREYSTVIVVPSIVCAMTPTSLARTCASIGTGATSAATSAARLVKRSTELAVDRGANLIERLCLLVETDGQLPLTLADFAVASHALAFVAREQRVERRWIRATAVAPDAIDDLGDLADGVEERNELRSVGELFF